MQYEKIHIDEEKSTLIWGLIAFVAISLAVLLLINVFFVGDITTAKLIISLVLLAIAGFSIMRATSPIYRFDLFIKDSVLIIEISTSNDPRFDTQEIPLSDISRLRISSHMQRSRGDALFDFSTNYFLLYQSDNSKKYKRLIYPEGKLFTFKVEDIRKIIGFLASHNSNVEIPSDYDLFME